MRFTFLERGIEPSVIHYLYHVPNTGFARFQDDREDAFPRHDAVAGLLPDGAVGMTFFSNLCDFTEGGADPKLRADRQRGEGDALTQDVLGKRARVERDGYLFLHALHALFGQKAHLSVPVSGMCIAHDAVVRTKFDPVDGVFLLAFNIAKK